MIETFIPCGEVPNSKFAGRPPSCWMVPDSEEHYRRRPHPLYGVQSIVYEFNSHGYRCPEFDQRSEINLLVIGCSWTFGTGLPLEATYPEVLRREIAAHLDRSVTCWNLGLPGHSNDYISRTLLTAVPALRPDLVLVMFTESSRREFITSDGTLMNIIPHMRSMPETSPLGMEILKHYQALVSPYQDELNLVRNYKLVELLLHRAGVPWLFTALNPAMLDSVLPWLDRQHYLGFGIENLDYARDYVHPGSQSHGKFARDILGRVAAVLAKSPLRSLTPCAAGC